MAHTHAQRSLQRAIVLSVGGGGRSLRKSPSVSPSFVEGNLKHFQGYVQSFTSGICECDEAL